jgi:hypothetical protein
MTMSPFDFSQILEALQEPFPSSEVEFKPGALNRDRSKALALAYVDSRAYIQRLNLVTPDWQDEYQVSLLPDRVVVLCRLTLAGVTRTGDGECLLANGEAGEQAPEANAVTTASAQAFKRACVKFGLGAYLYSLPQVWCEYDAEKRRIVNPPSLPEWALPAGERLERRERAAVEREVQLEGRSDPIAEDLRKLGFEPEPAIEDPGKTEIHFGRYAGKTLADVWALGKEGQGWVRWCANPENAEKGYQPKTAEGQHLQRMARAFIMANAAYAG